MTQASKLALFGGEPTVKSNPGDMFVWPVITEEDEAAVLDVLRRRAMSGSDVTRQFEQEFSEWLGVRYSLGYNTGTAALQAAMYACGVGVGDEIICPSVTYWASALQCFSLGATVAFADVDPWNVSLDPNDIERHITKRTKAIMVVHYMGYPADMDRIMPVARKHGLKVIEDVSHAQGSLYKGRKVGTFGDVAAMSLMSGKSLAIGEAGILCTNDLGLFEHATAFGHYERTSKDVQTEELRPYAGLPLGGYKYRMHQMSAAVGRVQLKYYDKRCKGIDDAMNYFWDQLEGVRGLRPIRPEKGSGSTMGGWYFPHGIYLQEELSGLSVTRFVQALRAEGVSQASPGVNRPLHMHPIFHDCDIYGHGKPTRIANSDHDMREKPGDLPVSDAIGARTIGVPWFKHLRKEIIDEYTAAYRKVLENYEALLPEDPGNPTELGGWSSFRHR